MHSKAYIYPSACSLLLFPPLWKGGRVLSFLTLSFILNSYFTAMHFKFITLTERKLKLKEMDPVKKDSTCLLFRLYRKTRFRTT